HQQLLPGGLPAAANGGAAGAGGDEVSAELAKLFEEFWSAHRDRPLTGRNKILAGVCPGVAGLLPVKLAALLVLIGGVTRRDEGGTHIRGELHLLLVGDPGTGATYNVRHTKYSHNFIYPTAYLTLP
ncbi:hypothetical protein Agub_g9786, partial [Astrephomene gubernaculifera]